MDRLATVWLIARKDLRVFFRDRIAVLLGFLLPIILIAASGFVMKFAFPSEGGMPRVTLWVAEEDQSQPSRRLVALLRENETLDVRPQPDDSPLDAAAARRLVEDGEAHHALVIHAGYGAAIEAGKLPELTVVRDPGRALEDRVIQLALVQTFMMATQGQLWPAALANMMRDSGMDEAKVEQIVVAARALNRVIRDFFAQTSQPSENSPATDRRGDRGSDPAEPLSEPSGARGDRLPVDPASFVASMVPIRTVDLQPPSRPARLSYWLSQSVAGTTVMMLMFGLMGCSTMLIQERESGTLVRLLAAPAPRQAVFWGKFLFCALVGLAQLAVLFLFGNAVFQIDAFRDPLTLAVLCLTWAAAATSFGMLVASWARTTKQAEGLSTLLILVMASLGGCWFPVQMMRLPRPVELVTQSTLTYWAMKGFQGMFWERWSWVHPRMLTYLGVQWAFVAGATLVALHLYRRRYVTG